MERWKNICGAKGGAKMDISLMLVGFILCALASFAGAFFGVRSMSENTPPLRIPIYHDIKDAVEKKQARREKEDYSNVIREYLYGEKGEER